MINIGEYIEGFWDEFHGLEGMAPWAMTGGLPKILEHMIRSLGTGYVLKDGMAIHSTAGIETGAVLKGPIVIGSHCFVGAHAYLRGGVFLGAGSVVGPGCEVKTSVMMAKSVLAHFNFVGDSIIGRGVNFEAGAVIANHYNERADKRIRVVDAKGTIMDTGTEKFGALVGDGCRVGANAVLSPGTLLRPTSIVKRLKLVEQTF